jgi:DNA-binding transcriptional LysR family regulator
VRLFASAAREITTERVCRWEPQGFCAVNRHNIPTELLRTLITVVDVRSFTKAAHALGVTQPAVSAQIKRLQFLLGTELLDKSAPGVSLTFAGETVVNYARRLLSINDQILDLAAPRMTAQTLRIGMTSDFAAPALGPALARFRIGAPDTRFVFRSGTADTMERDLREGDVDVLIALSANGAVPDTRRHWTEELVWVGTPATQLDPARPVPVVSYGEECLFHRTAVAALHRAGRDHIMGFVGATIALLCSAVIAGFGVMVWPRSRVADMPGLAICEDKSLPVLPDVFCGVHVREGGQREMRDQLADAIVGALRSSRAVSPDTAVKPAALAGASPAA